MFLPTLLETIRVSQEFFGWLTVLGYQKPFCEQEILSSTNMHIELWKDLSPEQSKDFEG